jgi:hypothetical protein
MARSRLPFALPTSVRGFVVAAVVAAASLSLAGCGGSGAPGPDTIAVTQTDSVAPAPAQTLPGSVLDPSTMLAKEVAFHPAWSDTGVFSAASNCASCHQASVGAPGVMTHEGRDVSPSTGWAHSMMAHSMNDPYFIAKVVSEVAVMPHLAGVIEDKCTTCHAPMGRTHAHQTGIGLDADGNYRLATALTEMHAREGVSCTACHQIVDDGKLGTAESFSGAYRIDATLLTLFGPYPSPVTQAMQNQTQYTPAHGAHMSTSLACASCHTLFTPTVDPATGQFTGATFAEQSTYLEWRNSAYAPGGSAPKECQACHMPSPADGYATKIATRNGDSPPDGWPGRTPFAEHAFVGGNTHMLALLRDHRTTLGIEASTTVAGFDAEIAKTRDLLENRTAELAILAPSAEGAEIEIPVRVRNLSGHKLPTAYPSRRVWLHLKVTDAAGAVVFESGRPDPNGRLSIDTPHLAAECLAVDKPAGFDYASCYEPHRDRIDSPEQVAVYESVMGDVNGKPTYVLLHGAGYLKDNRLPPAGFRRAAIPADGTTAIVGVPDIDADFSAEGASDGSGEDIVRYEVDTIGRTGPFTVEARLLYQSVRPTFAAGLHSTDARVERYKAMYAALPPTVEVLAAAGVRLGD